MIICRHINKHRYRRAKNMKKIIDGKRYDTDTAKEMGSDSFSNRRDFHYWMETLYRKNTGEFFLHGEGGPMSRYAVTTGQNEWSGGEKIIPLTIESAKSWAEEHLDADQYEKIFGVVTEDGYKKTVTFSLPETIIEKIKHDASQSGMTMSDYVADCIAKA